ncbi:MAG: alpha-ketoglutarate-dependent dioxygenase AlkB, partial [Hyphomonadaceae bacterium]|nr:alpha-ketoglutarate-dependent dioxygenase AlkB [Hyphomonadaceae bacterium]
MRLLPGYFGPTEQAALVAAVWAAADGKAPFVTPRLPRTGAPMSVLQTSFGAWGWVTDKERGYRYEPAHPLTGAPWPPIPALLLDLWAAVSDYGAPPDSCLVNLYRGGARMGLHVDADEQARDAPVVSVSLGDTAVFRIGG